MLPIYLAMLDGEEDKNKFSFMLQKFMFYVANRILNDERLAEDLRRFEFENFDKVKFPVTKLRATCYYG